MAFQAKTLGNYEITQFKSFGLMQFYWKFPFVLNVSNWGPFRKTRAVELRINISDWFQEEKGSVFAPSPNVGLTASLAAEDKIKTRHIQQKYQTTLLHAVELKLAEILKHGPSVWASENVLVNSYQSNIRTGNWIFARWHLYIARRITSF